MPDTAYRKKIIDRDLEKCKAQHLSGWEKEFVTAIDAQVKRNIALSTKQFNYLQDIAEHGRVVSL